MAWTKAATGWMVEFVARPKDWKGFAVLPRRWVVERTFPWLGRARRLSKDYEALPETSEAGASSNDPSHAQAARTALKGFSDRHLSTNN